MVSTPFCSCHGLDTILCRAVTKRATPYHSVPYHTIDGLALHRYCGPPAPALDLDMMSTARLGHTCAAIRPQVVIPQTPAGLDKPRSCQLGLMVADASPGRSKQWLTSSCAKLAIGKGSRRPHQINQIAEYMHRVA